MQRANRYDEAVTDRPQDDDLPPELRQVVHDLFGTWAARHGD